MQILSALQTGRAYSVDTLPTKRECAEMTTLAKSGVVYANNYAVTHKQSNQNITTYILSSQAETLAASRLAVASLTGFDLSYVKWTYASMGRQLSEWLGIRQRCDAPARELIPIWHYQKCIPCTGMTGELYDMKSAYWQIASKAKSLLCDIDTTRGKVRWRSLTPQQEDRWERTKRELEPYKRLRLAIIGVNATGWKPENEGGTMYYVRGISTKIPGKPPSCFQSLALLTVRVAYELTQVQSNELDCYYANADSIFCDTGYPDYWRNYGIQFSSKAAGIADIKSVGAWKIGDKQSGLWDACGLNYHVPARIDCADWHLKMVQ